VEKGIRITHPFLLKKLNTKKKGIVGCNFSLHKEDFLSVNGFDNRYDIPSIGEDTDIEYRLVKQRTSGRIVQTDSRRKSHRCS